MEHLPLPSNPVLKSLPIPFLCTEDYDGGDFREYASRHGWTFSGVLGKTSVRREGTTASMTELGAFLQTWLIFGLIWKVTGEHPDMDAFQRLESGSKFLSTASLIDLIPSWTKGVVEQGWSENAVDLAEWSNSIHTCLNLSYDLVITLKLTPAYADLDLVLLSLAAIIECFQQARLDVVLWKRAPIGPSTLRIRSRKSQMDCGDLLLRSMRENGWCPSKLAQLDAPAPMELGVCWFFANMRPPDPARDHNSCSRKDIKSAAVTAVTLVQTKTTWRQVIESGFFPIAKTVHSRSDNSSKAVVKVEPRLVDTAFVAISHVWADGHGNPDGNILPSCFLLNLQAMVDALPRDDSDVTTPFWIDTLCIPRHPLSLRNKALGRLREPYETAKHVLVLDSFLRSLKSDGMTLTEIVAYITACRWTQRLWTFQEGFLGKRIWFQFQERALELSELVEEWNKKFRRIPSSPSTSVVLDIIARYTASIILPDVRDASMRASTAFLRMALCTRSTSEATDEALCLATLLRLDLAEVLNEPPSQRMQAFWRHLPDVPWGFVFSRAARKLEVPGLRWAPATFMGEPDNSSWMGKHWRIDDGKKASIADLGIVVSLTALRIGCPDNVPDVVRKSPPGLFRALCATNYKEEHGMILTDAAGRWYRCYLEQDWHSSPACYTKTGQQQFAIVLPVPWDPKQLRKPRDDFDTGGSTDGILVTYDATTSTNGMPIIAKAHKHVGVHIMGRKRSLLWNMFRKCADQSLQAHSKLSSDDTAVQASDSLQTDDQYLIELVGKFARTEPGLFELDAELDAHYGDQTSEESTIRVAFTFVRLLIRGTGVFVMDAIPETSWCLD
ncbi:hypothetical protein H2200_001393 [Cladophialophora chaetospira]|uniref:Heterokaryon incompatibility domain-containing protein n=1 Tax=Cladophialophora chaetospira TaxID=386627 RepID=A0AA38XKX6_9EURO|nr:hypothetical protein H2200_001393 [Cladophialophora chaetospira]